jgi:hypothetical protein
VKQYEKIQKKVLGKEGNNDYRTHEDIYTIQPSPIPNEEQQVVAKDKSNEIRIGPITRAHAKLLNNR